MALHSDLAMPTGTRSVPTKRAAAMRRWPGHGHEAKMAQNQNECRWVGSLDHDKSKVSERWWKIEFWKGPTIAVRPYPCHLWVLHRRLEGYWGMDSAGSHIPNLFFEGESAQYAARKFTFFAPKNRCPKMGLDHLPFPIHISRAMKPTKALPRGPPARQQPVSRNLELDLLEFLLFFLTGVLYVV